VFGSGSSPNRSVYLYDIVRANSLQPITNTDTINAWTDKVSGNVNIGGFGSNLNIGSSITNVNYLVAGFDCSFNGANSFASASVSNTLTCNGFYLPNSSAAFVPFYYSTNVNGSGATQFDFVCTNVYSLNLNFYTPNAYFVLGNQPQTFCKQMIGNVQDTDIINNTEILTGGSWNVGSSYNLYYNSSTNLITVQCNYNIINSTFTVWGNYMSK
jgi:hypothetical protein